jgi:hypothetical protein
MSVEGFTPRVKEGHQLSGYRITLFADGPHEVTDEVVNELAHAIRLYESDEPTLRLRISAVAPIEKEGHQ